MEENYSVPLSKIIDEFKLETISLPDLPENVMVTCARVNRPGLQFVGFYDHYEQARIQIVGLVEHLYLHELPDEERHKRLDDFFRSKPVGVILTTSIVPGKYTEELAEKYGIKQAPTLVVVSGDNAVKIENASNIRKFIAEAKA